MDLQLEKHIQKLIQTARQILILTHIEPDADAIGSLLGLGRALRSIGKMVVTACSDVAPSRYANLPGYAGIASYINGNFDLMISLDCADHKRIGHLYSEASGAARRERPMTVLNIDHHISNTKFGNVNWIEPQAVATAEMVLDLVDRLGAAVDTEVATCVLYGIVGDTQAFRTPNVTPQVLAKVVRLMQLGAPLHQAVSDLFQRKPPGLLAVWGHTLSTMRIEDRLAWATLSADTRRQCGYFSTDGLQLSSLLLEADGVDVTAVFLENDAGEIEISMRARNGFDLSGLAKELGGGGHPGAAGATLEGPLEQAAQGVIARLKQAINGQLEPAQK